jgi:hypothetical protein
MKIKRRFILSFIAPFMILISAMGLIFRDNTRKIFYFPIGLMGISIILEKDFRRRLDRKNIFKKIKSFQNNK